MNRLIRLYPPAWRARYGDELLALLAERPPTMLDRLDILRGAVDARLHPQLSAAHGGDEGATNMSREIAGGSAVIAGVLWALGGIVTNATAITPALGYKEPETGMLSIFAGSILTAVAAVLTSRALGDRRRIQAAAAILIVFGVVLMPLGWPTMMVGALLAAVVGPAVFGFATYRAVGRPSAALLAVAAIVVLFVNTEDARALLTVPYGLAWVLFGLDVALRPAPARLLPAAPQLP